MTRNPRRIRPTAPLDESLQAEIKVKRPPQRWQRPSFWLLVLAGLFAAWCLLRLSLADWPLLEARARPAHDGYRALQGVFDLRVCDDAGRCNGRAGVEEAFRQGFQWVVAADVEASRALDLVNQAPFPLVAAALQDNAGSRWILFGGADPLPLLARRRFEDIRGAGGVVVLAPPPDGKLPWRELQAQSFDGIELFDLVRRPPADSPWDALWTGLARLLRRPYRHLATARRPVENLARLDDLNRRRRTLLFCGAGSDAGASSDWPGLATMVLVPESQGPWYPREIAEALRAGRHFCAMPFLGDASGFRFFAARRDGALVGMMGDALVLEPGLSLVADMNLSGEAPGLRLRLLLDGLEVARAEGSRLTFQPEKPGAYRVEASLPAPRIPLGSTEAVFVLSNPIFLSGVSPTAPPPAARTKDRR